MANASQELVLRIITQASINQTIAMTRELEQGIHMTSILSRVGHVIPDGPSADFGA